MNLTEQERSAYADIWDSVEGYDRYAPGEQYLGLFTEIMKGCGKRPSETTILEAGCGSGKAGAKLAELGYSVRLFDLTNAGLVPEAQALPFYAGSIWQDLWPAVRGFGHPGRMSADFVYCCDVLEHLPKQFTMLAVDQMLRVARHGVFLSVALVPDGFGVWIGKELHQTVESFVWWRDSLRELAPVIEARDLQANAVFFLVRE